MSFLVGDDLIGSATGCPMTDDKVFGVSEEKCYTTASGRSFIIKRMF